MKILREQNKELRYYFKLIKDYGGFKPFDLSGRNKEFRIVDMDEEKRKDREEAFAMMMASKGEDGSNTVASSTSVAVAIAAGEGGVVDKDKSSNSSSDVAKLTADTKETVVHDDDGANISSEKDSVDEEFSLFSQGGSSTGPMMM